MKKLISLLLSITIVLAAVPVGVLTFTVNASNVCAEHDYSSDIDLQCDNCGYVRSVVEIIDRIEVDDLDLPEGDMTTRRYSVDCITNEHVDVWYEYYYNPTWTLFFKDGSTLRSDNGYGVHYEGNYLYLTCSDDQSYEKQWLAGGNYTSTCYLNVGEFSDVCNVTIIETPFESIEITSYKPIKESDYTSITPNGDKLYGTISFEYKVTDKEGNVAMGEYPGESCMGYWPTYYDYQIDTPWKPGVKNKVYVTFAGLTTEFFVEIIEVGDWEYIEQGDGIFITSCNLDHSDLIVPDSVDGKTVIGIMDFGKSVKYAQTITIPDTVTFVSKEAISGMYANEIHTINIGKGVANLDADMFAMCFYLTDINISEQNESYSSVDGVLYNKSGDTLVMYPLGLDNTYIVPENVVNIDVLYSKPYYYHLNIVADPNSKTFKTVDDVTYNADMTIVISCDDKKTGEYVMPESVTNIAGCAFSNSKLSSVTISKNVTVITYYSFAHCNNLETINMPDSITSIEDTAFLNSNLKNLKVLPKSLKTLGYSAFKRTQMTAIELPDNIEAWGDEVFAQSQIESVTIPDSVAEITYEDFCYAFSDCINLKKVVLPKSMQDVPAGLFTGCTSLTNITIPDGVERILDGAFAGCTALKKVVIPQSVNYIYSGGMWDGDVFEGCENLKIYGYEGSYAKVYADKKGIPFVDMLNIPDMPGDINDDENINNKDLGLLMQYLNNWNVEINIDAADVNCDSAVNNKDYGLLMQYLNNWDVELQ